MMQLESVNIKGDTFGNKLSLSSREISKCFKREGYILKKGKTPKEPCMGAICNCLG